MSRQPVDSRPLTDDLSPKASLGKQKPDANANAARTWALEARNNALRSIDYFKRAADFYDKAGDTKNADLMREASINLKNNLIEVY